MEKYLRFCALLGLVSAISATSSGPSSATAGLANPAAEYCIETGGFYGIREGDLGQSGVCKLANGEDVDAWEYYRENLLTDAVETAPKLANPAASHCEAIGGSYDLETSKCQFPDGSEADAWDLLRDAHAGANALANPAATHCIALGGAYEIENRENGQVGMCTLESGVKTDAWKLLRETD